VFQGSWTDKLLSLIISKQEEKPASLVYNGPGTVVDESLVYIKTSKDKLKE